jgi:cytoskeleton protein RodZ
VTPPAPPKSGERQVTLLFEDESWVEIRDRDGKVILWQLNLPGTRQVVSGRPPLSFVIGNAHGVRLTYDDRAVDLAPYTRTDVARMTLE